MFLKIGNLLVGLIVIAFAALLFTDSVLSHIDLSNQLFSLADVKGIVGFVLIVFAAPYFLRVKEN